jgi:photosynthetic reaction center cytochrome c subunit
MNRKDPLNLQTVVLAGAFLVIVIFVGLMFAKRPQLEVQQAGFRGTGMLELFDKPVRAAQVAASVVPVVIPPTGPLGPPAGVIYKNVQVLKDLSVGEFTRLMASITTWVSPDGGCAYCHNVDDMASDAVYTKVASRRMIQMVQHINADWGAHVAASAPTGVTCYTCHRGSPVPPMTWTNDPGPKQAAGYASKPPLGLGHAAVNAGLTAMTYDPFSVYLEQKNVIRVEGTTPLPTGNHSTIFQTEGSYGLMMYMSDALGVNCTFCHNTRQFGDWSQSTPQRVTAWQGIAMVQDLNLAYLNPLGSVLPKSRLGVLGDAPKVNCTTCHMGVNKPLFGAQMVKDFPELTKVTMKP